MRSCQGVGALRVPPVCGIVPVPPAPGELEGHMSMMRAYAWFVAALIWSVVLLVAAATFT